jgi:uncharacterized membrane protein (UPF0127 family)
MGGLASKTATRVAMAVIALGVLSVLRAHADMVPRPHLSALDLVPSSIPGLGQEAFSFSGPDRPAPAVRRCLLVADRPAQLAEGLNGISHLLRYPGLVIEMPRVTAARLVSPVGGPPHLEAAFFGSAGQYVGRESMAPCRRAGSCPSQAPPSPYRYAVEGHLAGLGIGPGSKLEAVGACEQ